MIAREQIPNEYHFIFGLSPDFGGKPFSLIHYIAVMACHVVNRPNKINFYYAFEPTGIWWARAKPYLSLVRVDPPDTVHGKRLNHVAHKADVLRLEILLANGGIYLDLDVWCIKPFADLLCHEVVLGQETGVGLCNAVILATKDAPFLRQWLASYEDFDDRQWNEHSVKLPSRLAESFPELHIVGPTRFFWPMHDRPEDLRRFFMGSGSAYCKDSYCVHLWETATWAFLRSLTLDDLARIDSECFLLARRVIAACETNSTELSQFPGRPSRQC